MVVAIFVLAWVVIGLLTAVAMYSRGHDIRPWGALGILLGPLLIPLAVTDARREHVTHSISLVEGKKGRGQVDVLAGTDGSEESRAALDEALSLIGPRIGRLTLAHVVDFDTALEEEDSEHRRAAEELLAEEAERVAEASPSQLLLVGKPSAALEKAAAEGDYELIVVGGRGSGHAPFFGGTTRGLRHISKVPLFVGCFPSEADGGADAGGDTDAGSDTAEKG